MKVSVVIVSYRVKAFLEQCLRSVEASLVGVDSEIWVVDNASHDGTAEMVQSLFPSVHWIENQENVGFSKANNQALERAQGEYLLVLNPDTVMAEGTIQACIQAMADHPHWGALGIRMIDGTGKYLPESKRGLPTPWVSLCKMTGLTALFPTSRWFSGYYMGNLSPMEVHEVEILAGAFMFVRRDAYLKVGGLDEAFFMYGEDIDWSHRFHLAGYATGYLPHPALLHYKGESTKHGSLNYVKVFYGAMSIFVRKHFSGQYAWMFHLLILAGIQLKSVLSVIRRGLKFTWMPAMDAAVLYAGHSYLANYWESNHRFITGGSYPDMYFLGIIPMYAALVMVGMVLRDAYRKPVTAARLWGGILTGSALLWVTYALLPEHLRFSRALLALGTVWALMALPLWRWVAGKLLNNPVMVGTSTERPIVWVIGATADVVRQRLEGAFPHALAIHYNPSIPVDQIPVRAQALGYTDVVLCHPGIAFENQLKCLEPLHQLGIEVHLMQRPDGALIGSEGAATKGHVYEGNPALAQPAVQREKRRFDILFSWLMLFAWPVVLVSASVPRERFKWAWKVIHHRATWVGYPSGLAKESLPHLPESFATCWLGDATMEDPALMMQSAQLYAAGYTTALDFKILLRGWRKRR